jgi:hypothetical protein
MALMSYDLYLEDLVNHPPHVSIRVSFNPSLTMVSNHQQRHLADRQKNHHP